VTNLFAKTPDIRALRLQGAMLDFGIACQWFDDDRVALKSCCVLRKDVDRIAITPHFIYNRRSFEARQTAETAHSGLFAI